MSEPSATSAAVISADAPSRKEKKRRSRPRREALPAGWTEMRHNNGLPFYYHTESGTVCWTRPYVRKFKVEEHAPLLSSFAIVLEDHTSDDPAKTARDEASLEEELASNALQSGSGLEPATEEQSAVLESIEDLYEGSTLDQGPDQGDELEEGELIEEGDIEPAEELEHEPGTETERTEAEGTVTESGHAIKARALELVSLIVSKEKRRKRRTAEYGPKRGVKKRSAEDLSGVGKTPISFLQEYCLNIIKKTPNYRVTIQEDSKAPFVTEVVLDDAVIGRGSFSNKKTSKQLAALESLEHLCPGQYPRELLLKNVNLEVALKDDLNETRHLAIDDEKIMNLDGTSAKTPVQVLQEYCNREGSYVHYNSEEIGTSETKNRFSVTATLDQLQAEGTGKTKKEAKQRAAQLLLKQLHSDINTWGELLDYYETQKELHKDKGPNLQLLNLLKEKMRSIIQEQSTTTPKASEVTPVIVLTSDQPLVSPVPLSDAEFYRVKDKSCKDLDTEHNTPSHSPVVSRHNSFIHKARLRKEPVSEGVASESKGPSESAVESIDGDAERKRRRESDVHEDEPQRKVRKIDEGLSDSNTNSGKDNER